MKNIFLLSILVSLMFTNCSSDDNGSDIEINQENCNTLVFEKRRKMVENSIEYSENNNAENCNAVKKAAQDYKSAMIDCSLWDDVTQTSKDEIEYIIDLDC